MADIFIIALIGRKTIHLKRCVEKLAPFNSRQISLVESQLDGLGVAIRNDRRIQLVRPS